MAAHTVINSGVLPWTTNNEGVVVDADGQEVAQFVSQDDQDYAIRAANSFAELLAALKKILEGFDGGVFVRSVADDDRSDYAMRFLPYLKAIADGQAAIAKAESSPTGPQNEE